MTLLPSTHKLDFPAQVYWCSSEYILQSNFWFPNIWNNDTLLDRIFKVKIISNQLTPVFPVWSGSLQLRSGFCSWQNPVPFSCLESRVAGLRRLQLHCHGLQLARGGHCFTLWVDGPAGFTLLRLPILPRKQVRASLRRLSWWMVEYIRYCYLWIKKAFKNPLSSPDEYIQKPLLHEKHNTISFCGKYWEWKCVQK